MMQKMLEKGGYLSLKKKKKKKEQSRKYVKDFQPMVKVTHKVVLRLQQSKHLLFAKQKWQG